MTIGEAHLASGEASASRADISAAMLAEMNRRLYDQTDTAVWQLAVYEPAHGGRSFINMGGTALLDRLIEQGPITERCQLLDLCCGSAAPATYLVEHTGCQITAIEWNEAQVSRARSLVEDAGLQGSIDVQCGDVTRWRGPKRYDLAVSLDSLMLINDWAGVADTVAAQLAPSGKFFASTILGAPELSTQTRELLWQEDGMVSLLTQDEAERTLGAAGLREVFTADLNDAAVECLYRIDRALDGLRAQIER
ncbi:MAG: methyltransferase domain-containing protein, partial [Pseudomonadota bacterium]